MDKANKQRFRDAYRAYSQLVIFYLRKLNVSDDQLDDFLQEAFMRLFNNLNSVEEGKEKSFLLVTARNLVIDRYRKEKNRQTTVDSDQLVEAQEGLWRSDPQRDYELEVLGKMIDQFCVDDSYRAFRMFYLEGRSLQDIANACQEPIGTIASRVSRLRKKFKNFMRSQKDQFDYVGGGQ